MKKETKKLLTGLLMLTGAAALLILLNTKLALYSDDYWYGTFFRNGLSDFWVQMKEHYMTTNGRFFIHLLVPFVLLFDTKLFMVLSPLLLALLFYGGCRFLYPAGSRASALAGAALGILGVMACDSRYLRMTLLWISAYFNYIFPLCLLFLAARAQQKLAEGRRSPLLLGFGLLAALLAGASTEQCGIMTLVLLGGYVLFHWKKKSGWLFPAAALVGFLTILLAPGSWARVDRGVDGGILSCLQPAVFASRFFDAMHYVVCYPSTVVLLALLFTLAAATALTDRRLSRGLLLGFPLAAGQLLFFFLQLEKTACIWAVLGLLWLILLLLLQAEYRPIGLTLASALTSHLMLIITSMSSERTVFCGITALIAAAVALLLRLLGRLRSPLKYLLPAAAIILCICCWVPTFRGYSAVRETVDRNLQSIEESHTTGVCTFDLDMDPRYRYTTACDGAYFYENYRKYYRVPADAKMVFTSKVWSVEPLEGSIYPALIKDGVRYLPFDHALKSAGGSVLWSWQDHTYTIRLNGKTYIAAKSGTLHLLEPDGTKQLLAEDFTILSPHFEIDTLLYGDAEQLEHYFGVRL